MPPKSRRRQTRKPRPRKRKASQLDEWFSIRSIIGERATGGQVEYLVDWDANPETGEPYSPTWSREVTEAAKLEWEAKGAPPPQGEQHESTLESIESQDSQPPRPASWRRIQRVNTLPPTRRRAASAELSERPFKAPRVGYHSSEEPVPSITSVTSADTTAEAQASQALQQQELAHPQTNRLTIEIKENPALDPSDYHSVANTQTTGFSSQSLAEQEEEAARIALPITIADSQEPSGQSWSQSHPSGETATVSSPHQGETATSCIRATPHIPSRQPDHPAASGQSGPVTATFTSTSQSASRVAAAGPARSPWAASAPQTQSASSPVFLTQPNNPATFPLPDSSFSVSQVLESPQIGESGDAGQQASRASPQCSPGSQAAQVVDRDFTFPTEVATGSSGDRKVEGQREKSTSGTLRGSHNSFQVAGSSQLPTSHSNHAMDRSGSGAGASPTRRTTDMDELNLLVNLGGSPVREPAHAVQTASAPAIPDVPASDYQATVSETATGGTMPSPYSLEGQSSYIMGGPGSYPMEAPVAPSSDFDVQLPTSATQVLQDIITNAFSSSNSPAPGTVLPGGSQDKQDQTVSPAEITKQNTIPLISSIIPSEATKFSAALDSSMESMPTEPMPIDPITLAQTSDQTSEDPESNVGIGNRDATEILITLPFQSNVRPLYDETLVDHRGDITRFGNVFSQEIYEAPDAALVKRIDGLFSRLHNHCDYPHDLVGTPLSQLSPMEQGKYSLDANAKFSFIYELFNGIGKDTKVLVVARSPELLRLLCHLTEMLEVEYVCDAIGKEGSNPTAAVGVTLVLPDDDIEVSQFDVVIGFDHAFAPSRIAKDLSLQSPQPASLSERPLVLILAMTHSIEHIYSEVPHDLPRLERMNALLSGIVRARRLVNDPAADHPQPHQIARRVVRFINDEVDRLAWEAIEVPPHVLDVYANSQAYSQMPLGDAREHGNGQKRKLDDIDETNLKRMRHSFGDQALVEANEPPLPDSVRLLLGSDVSEGPQVKVSVAALEALAEKHVELERQIAAARDDSMYKETISRLEKQVKENEATRNKTYKGYHDALEERSKSEAEKRKADRLRQEAAELSQRESDKAQRRITDLEAVNSRLMATSETAASESLLKEAQEKVMTLEKRLANAHKDVEYVKNLYQDATTSTTALRAENNQLNEQSAKLREQASENLARIHQVQADATTTEFQRRIKELKTQVAERERELDQARDEVRQLRSGRRETRQVSIPRSPAMGVMSPRAGRGQGSSISRGTSPARAMAVEVPTMSAPSGVPFLGQQPGNGRFHHLRD